MTRLTEIWRHPIKSLGRESLTNVALTREQCLPGDRLWAVTHAKAEFSGDPTGWQRCGNFLRCANGPGLMAITGRLDGERQVVLSHPDKPDLTVEPDTPKGFVDVKSWLSGIWPADMPEPTGLHANATGSLTDNSAPWISIHNHASHRAVEERVGRPLSNLRWRGNIWIDGLAPWQEFEWIGKDINIGNATLRIEERIERCRATMANPETGQRDADTLAALDTWGHRDFGVFASVIEGGTISVGDTVLVPD